MIISKSIKYVGIEDEALPQKGSTFRVKEIKKAMKSNERPMVEFLVAKVKPILMGL